jgi:phosphatidate cytidylyltransferase
MNGSVVTKENTGSPDDAGGANARPKGAAYWTQRIGVGIAGFGSTVAIIYAGRPEAFAAYLAIIGAWATHEFYRAVRRQNAEPSAFLGILACILFQASPFTAKFVLLHEFLPVLLASLMIATLLMELAKPSAHPIPNAGTTVFGAMYVGWLLSFFARLRLLDHHQVQMSPGITDYHVGAWLVIFVCAVTWMSDTMGLFVGYRFGKNKLAPTISPSKTWEGAIGGVFFATVFGTCFGHWLQFDALASVVLSFLIAVLGLLGDLCESALKRDLGLKDFGTIFANHGGALDRIDSLLFTAPFSYYFMLLFMHPK